MDIECLLTENQTGGLICPNIYFVIRYLLIKWTFFSQEFGLKYIG